MHAGQVSVQDDHVVTGVAKMMERRRSIQCHVDGHPFSTQAHADCPSEDHEILDHENSHVASHNLGTSEGTWE